jgi:hypothetical protein
VDGDPGSGKTTLANKMAAAFEAKVVSLDDYLVGDRGIPYCNQINSPSLRGEILASGPKLIIEGVCVLKILAEISVHHDYHIFIKRYDGCIGWTFGQYLMEKAKPPRDRLWREIVQYYKDYKPFDASDLVKMRDICQP